MAERRNPTPGTDLSAVWRLPDGVTLSWRDWDGEYVVFNGASGQSHVLDSLSAWILQRIEESPRAPNILLSGLVKEIGLGEAELAERMRAILSEFEKQGLAEPGRKVA